MDLSKFNQREQRLKAAMGADGFQKTVGAIKEVLKNGNLVSTPTILEDVLQHAKESIFLEKI